MYFTAPERPSAVIVGNQMLTPKVCQALETCAISVPRDLSVFCIDEHDDARNLYPQLSRFRIDVQGFFPPKESAIFSHRFATRRCNRGMHAFMNRRRGLLRAAANERAGTMIKSHSTPFLRSPQTPLTAMILKFRNTKQTKEGVSMIKRLFTLI